MAYAIAYDDAMLDVTTQHWESKAEAQAVCDAIGLESAYVVRVTRDGYARVRRAPQVWAMLASGNAGQCSYGEACKVMRALMSQADTLKAVYPAEPDALWAVYRDAGVTMRVYYRLMQRIAEADMRQAYSRENEDTRDPLTIATPSATERLWYRGSDAEAEAEAREVARGICFDAERKRRKAAQALMARYATPISERNWIKAKRALIASADVCTDIPPDDWKPAYPHAGAIENEIADTAKRDNACERDGDWPTRTGDIGYVDIDDTHRADYDVRAWLNPSRESQARIDKGRARRELRRLNREALHNAASEYDRRLRDKTHTALVAGFMLRARYPHMRPVDVRYAGNDAIKTAEAIAESVARTATRKRLASAIGSQGREASRTLPRGRGIETRTIIPTLRATIDDKTDTTRLPAQWLRESVARHG